MKTPAIIVIFSFIFATSCGKKAVPATGVIYKGIVLYNICCQDVIQTVGPEYLGQDSWIDSNNAAHPVYQHVFKVSNPCQFGSHNIGDTIHFKIIAQQVQDCAYCLLYVNTPDIAYPVQVIY